jgi:hypothetical protein
VSPSRENRRLTTEECRVLEIGPLVRAGLFLEPLPTTCTITWPEVIGSEHIGLEGTVSRWSENKWYLVLRHSMVHCLPPGPLALPFTLRITRTPCYYVGWRYWLRCPQVREGRLICRRRVTKLFLPPGHDSFGCRQCHDLSYRSVQEHDQRVDRLVKNLFLLPWVLTSPKRSLMLKAYIRLVQRLDRKALRSRTRRLYGTAANPFGQGNIDVI